MPERAPTGGARATGRPEAIMMPAVRLEQIAEALAAAMREYLPRQRWFGAKGRALEHVAFEDFVPVPSFDRARVAIVRATFADGAARFQMPLLLDAGSEERARITVATADGTATLADASADAGFRRALAGALGDGAESAGSRWRWSARPLAGGAAQIGAVRDGPSKAGSAEQSNTSLIYDDRVVVKLFRRLETGENPDPEIGAALSAAGFPHVPRVLARAFLEGPDGRSDAALGQEFIADSRDAWSWALANSRGPMQSPPDRDLANEYPEEARRLGEVTRELHDALAGIESPDFGARPASASDVQRWERSALAAIDTGLGRLERALQRKVVPAEREPEATAVVRRGDAYRAHARALATLAAADPGMMIRHHGDYHLGQVLRTGDGRLYVVDFEGEPARPLAERRARNSPLRDVAGMLRSFGYAAATLLSEVAERLPMAVRELRGGRWERDARQAFFEGYRIGEPGSVLPRTREGAEAVADLFEAEKAFYELAYEIDNRPDWAWIPMRGISKLLVKR